MNPDWAGLVRLLTDKIGARFTGRDDLFVYQNGKHPQPWYPTSPLVTRF